MDFRTLLLSYMREHAPDVYARLKRDGLLEAYLTEACDAAFRQLAATVEADGLAGDEARIDMAATIVLTELLAPFTPSEDRQTPEAYRQWKAFVSGARTIDVPSDTPQAGARANQPPGTGPLEARAGEALSQAASPPDWIAASDGGIRAPPPAERPSASGGKGTDSESPRQPSVGGGPGGTQRQPPPKATTFAGRDPAGAPPGEEAGAPRKLLPRLVGPWLIVVIATCLFTDRTADLMADAYHLTLALSVTAIGLGVLVFLPMSFFRTTLRVAHEGFALSTWVFVVAAWVGSWSLTYTAWGAVGVMIGVGLFGLGVVPLGLIGAALDGQWASSPLSWSRSRRGWLQPGR
ncbi:MAG TPA: hypothetical protein VHW60_09190 [Caulobacteraceae bacterium]|jgi:hypothetical protein|nr:hypothetical protein [Caulobacteraceae bacterium]